VFGDEEEEEEFAEASVAIRVPEAARLSAASA
jgi:hypothetical protein